MKIYFSFTRGYALALCATFIAVFAILSVASFTKSEIKLCNEAQRSTYLLSFGIKTESPSYVKTVYIPKTFNDTYKNYNSALKKGGFDLSEYKCKNLTEYTYLTDFNAVVRILTDGDTLVGSSCCFYGDSDIYALSEVKEIGNLKAG